MYESAIIAILRVTECGFRGKTDIAISERHAPFEPKRTLSGQICCAAKHSDVAVCYDTVVSPSRRVPTIYAFREYAEAGRPVTCGVDLREQYHQV
ncbi:MAG: hypothetical protein WAV38_18930 [Xanthobacteraceae bacterium]